MTEKITKTTEKQTSVLEFIADHKSEFATVLPKHLSPDRMMRVALSAIRTTPHLAECSVQSVAVSLMACSSLGLEPNTPLGHAYLIPYNCSVKRCNNKWEKEWRCQLIVGYRGFIELFYRSGVVDSVQAYPVFGGDKFEVQLGLHPDLIHVPSTDQYRWNPEKMTHVYGVIHLKGVDRPMWAVMDRFQIEQRRERSKAKEDGPWKTDFVAMSLKTVIRDMHRWVPFSVDKAAAAASFEGSLEGGGHVRDAVISLGPEAVEVSSLLLAGVEEDAPASVEQDEKPTIDVAAKMSAEKLFNEHAIRAVDAARAVWGDEGMRNLVQMLRKNGVAGLSSATDEQLDAATSEINRLANE